MKTLQLGFRYRLGPFYQFGKVTSFSEGSLFLQLLYGGMWMNEMDHRCLLVDMIWVMLQTIKQTNKQTPCNVLLFLGELSCQFISKELKLILLQVKELRLELKISFKNFQNRLKIGH